MFSHIKATERLYYGNVLCTHHDTYSLRSRVLLAAAVPAHGAVVAHWTFDAFEGGIYPDAIGNSHPATPKDPGAVQPYEGNQPAPFGKAIKFNGGAGAYLTIPALSGIQKNSLSVAAWVNFANKGPNFVLTDWPSNAKAGFVFGVNPLGGDKNSAQPIADLASGETGRGSTNRLSVVRQALANKPVPLNEWHHMVWTWDRDLSTLTTYLDGDQIGETKKPAQGTSKSLDLAVNNAMMRIGSQEMAINRVVPVFNGAIDELWVFDQLLTPIQIRNLMRSNDTAAAAPAPIASVAPAPVTPTPAGTPTPVVADPTPADRANASSISDTPVSRTPVLGSSSKGLGAGRVVGVLGCLSIIVTMACYLIWAVKERAKIRTAR